MRWQRIKQVLKARHDAPVDTPSAEAFWADFRAHARMVPQIEPTKQAHSPLFGIPEWTMATICVLLVSLGGWFLTSHGLPDNAPPNRVHSLRVPVPYAALMLMYDPASQATIVWIEGMNVGDDPESGA